MSVFKRFSNSKRSSSSKKNQKKRVTFVDVDEVDYVETFNNPQDIWFSKDEEFEFKQRDVKIGYLLQHEMDIHEIEIKTGESSRGLEHAQRGFGEAMQMRRSASLQAVESTQALYTELCKDGSDQIAAAYAFVTEKAMQSALQRAAVDQKFVMDQVRTLETKNRVFEQRLSRPSVMGRQLARRSLQAVATSA